MKSTAPRTRHLTGCSWTPASSFPLVRHWVYSLSLSLSALPIIHHCIYSSRVNTVCQKNTTRFHHLSQIYKVMVFCHAGKLTGASSVHWDWKFKKKRRVKFFILFYRLQHDCSWLLVSVTDRSSLPLISRFTVVQDDGSPIEMKRNEFVFCTFHILLGK